MRFETAMLPVSKRIFFMIFAMPKDQKILPAVKRSISQACALRQGKRDQRKTTDYA